TAMSAGNVSYRNNNVSNIFVMPVTYEYDGVFSLRIEKGRYFNLYEYERGANKVILGHKVAESLFGPIDPLDKLIKIRGMKYEVIGVFEEEGESLINFIPYDNMAMVPWTNGKKLMNYEATIFT